MYHLKHFGQPNAQSGPLGQVSFVARPRWETELREGSIFDGIERDVPIEVGLSLLVENGFVFGEVTALTDATNVHQGYELELKVGAQTQVGRFGIQASLATVFQDANLRNHLFGVGLAEASPTRPAFSTSDGSIYRAELSASYGLTRSVSLIGLLNFDQYGELKESPLLERSSSWGAGIGLVYTF